MKLEPKNVRSPADPVSAPDLRRPSRQLLLSISSDASGGAGISCNYFSLSTHPLSTMVSRRLISHRHKPAFARCCFSISIIILPAQRLLTVLLANGERNTVGGL